jgi:hypothetical protein
LVLGFERLQKAVNKSTGLLIRRLAERRSTNDRPAGNVESMTTTETKLTPEMVLPILQGLLASGDYTVQKVYAKDSNEKMPEPRSATYDSGPPRCVAVQDAVKLASEMLEAIDDHNARMR